MSIIFKIISTRHRVNGDSSPPSQIFHHLVHNFYSIHSPILHLILLFQDNPLKKKSELEKSIEVVQAMLEFQQKKLNSLIPQYFHDSYSISPIQTDQPALKTSMEWFRESELQSQNMLDSQFSQSSQSFQNQDSYIPFLEHPLEEISYLEKSIESCRSPHYNFKNIHSVYQ